MDSYLDELQKELEDQGVRPINDGSNSRQIVGEQYLDKYDMNAEAINHEYDILAYMENRCGLKYSEEQRNILLNHNNSCILACAGSGKTSVSTHLIAKRLLNREITDPSKVIYTTYSKSGATEMKERLDKLFERLEIKCDIQVRTLHSFFLQILRTFSPDKSNISIISEGQRQQYIREAAREVELVLRDDDLMILSNLLSYQVNWLLSDKDTIDSYVNTLDDMTIDQYIKIRQLYAVKKQKNGYIDYDDMQTTVFTWVVQLVKSDVESYRQMGLAVREYCRSMWTDFYIDEAQDISKLQFAIIRALITDISDKNKLTAKLTFIGDDDQCIYSWRGSDPSIILTIGATFNINVFKLTTNYRCKSKIVDYAISSVKCNTSRYEKGMKAYEQGGDVRIKIAEKQDLCGLSNIARNHIKYWLSKGSKPTDIAVLSRNNFHLSILNNMLLRDGIYCNITNEMKLTKSSMYKDIKSLLNIVAEPNYSTEVTANILWRLCRFMGAANSRAIASFQSSCGLEFTQLIGFIIKKFIDNSIEFNKKVFCGLQDEEKLRYYIEVKLSPDTRQDIKTLYDVLMYNDDNTKFKALCFMYLSASGFLYKTKDKNRSINGLIEYMTSVVDELGIKKTMDFFRSTEQLENGDMVISAPKVTLTTEHSAKGREWKNVIMFGCDNISQPSLDSIASMLSEGITIHDVCTNIEEERRLFYVGNTRAKENLLVITNKEPSVFILEALGILNTSNNDTKIIDFANGDSDWFNRYKEKYESVVLDPSSDFYYDDQLYKV